MVMSRSGAVRHFESRKQNPLGMFLLLRQKPVSFLILFPSTGHGLVWLFVNLPSNHGVVAADSFDVKGRVTQLRLRWISDVVRFGNVLNGRCPSGWFPTG